MQLSTILLVSLLVPSLPLLAQTRSGSVHTAPGKPLLLQRGQPAAYSPAKPPVVLPRYWALSDSAQRVAAYRRLHAHLQKQLRYPVQVLRDSEGWAIPSDLFRFRFVVNPDGSTQPPTLTARALTLAESAYKPSMVQALAAEATRVLGALHFAPAAKADTLTLPIVFPRW
ncbi:hypothetical protein [Hymenobacter edaphi]|uniref:TonB C-terminal domain-containing protein n=1 Tax=Hymenobacter edaphi TaxID=2211146 RepID=A0A328BRJ6_9BACT|nr:hypothetical protein [Hymenobacter edaphi]RAK69890.1 hypothetical protein DLM85_03270 [Hymenobacter edaphi]